MHNISKLYVSLSLIFRATHIPVGADQLQHLELTCDIAHTFNSRYGVDFFPKPQPLLSEGKQLIFP